MRWPTQPAPPAQAGTWSRCIQATCHTTPRTGLVLSSHVYVGTTGEHPPLTPRGLRLLNTQKWARPSVVSAAERGTQEAVTTRGGKGRRTYPGQLAAKLQGRPGLGLCPHPQSMPRPRSSALWRSRRPLQVRPVRREHGRPLARSPPAPACLDSGAGGAPRQAMCQSERPRGGGSGRRQQLALRSLLEGAGLVD